MQSQDYTEGSVAPMPDIVSLTARLAQLMAEEADLLDEMRISEIAEFQEEKRLLLDALERQKKQFDKRPEMLDDMDMQEREELREMMRVFNDILQENYRRLLVAKEVNQTMVNAVADVVRESRSNGVYNDGGASQTSDELPSVTLNQKI